MHENASTTIPYVLRAVEAGIYERLTRPGEQRPWAVRELVLELGDPLTWRMRSRTCTAPGWVHRCGEFVWATRAALAAEAIEL